MTAFVSTERGRLIGIDHGSKIIGTAVCDATQMIARPLTLLKRTTREGDFAAISALIMTYQPVGLVVGLPEMPADFQGVSQAETVTRWAIRLAGQVTLPVYLWEETYSSFEAAALIVALGLKPRERLDDIAAAVILQSFIDAHPAGTAYPEAVRPRRHRAL